MTALLDDILELTRVGRIVRPRVETPVVELAAEAADLLAAQVAAVGAEVEIDDAPPSVYGDRSQLVGLLQNLIGNALRFMGEQPRPRVEIGVSERDGEVRCFVRDNGMGIEPRHHERVFGVFDQLDPRQEGTGIGLAIARRTVEVHHGQIWVESEGAGHGSTFVFTLPKRPIGEDETDSR